MQYDSKAALYAFIACQCLVGMVLGASKVLISILCFDIFKTFNFISSYSILLTTFGTASLLGPILGWWSLSGHGLESLNANYKHDLSRAVEEKKFNHVLFRVITMKYHQNLRQFRFFISLKRWFWIRLRCFATSVAAPKRSVLFFLCSSKIWILASMQQHSTRMARITTALLTEFLAVEEKFHNSDKILNRSKFFFEDFPKFWRFNSKCWMFKLRNTF